MATPSLSGSRYFGLLEEYLLQLPLEPGLDGEKVINPKLKRSMLNKDIARRCWIQGRAASGQKEGFCYLQVLPLIRAPETKRLTSSVINGTACST